MSDNYKDPFKIPVSNEEPNNTYSSELKKEPKKKVVRLNLDRIPVVKVGFELPEDDDQEIELIAVKERKTKKDLLAEIVQDWLKRNKLRKI